MIAGLGALTRIDGTQPLSPAGPAQGAQRIGETSFSDLLSSLASGTVSNLQQAESLSMQALQGEADTRAVVDAVMSAEQSLQASIAIRDKIVSAYLEVSRMAI